jgi:hypothetical protein
MNSHETQSHATATSYEAEMRNIESNGAEVHSSVVPGRDPRAHEWAEVLRDLEAFY